MIKAAIPVLLGALLLSGCGAENPTAPTVVESPVTVTFASNLYPKGTVTRLLTAAQAGTITLTLDSLAQDVAVGLALGLSRSDGAGCYGTITVEATAGSAPQIASPVDAGNYCVSIYDIGNISAPATFSITIVHP
jgi:hypothetical protein